MKTKLYILLMIALFSFPYSYSKAFFCLSTTINDTIVLKSEEQIIEDTILLENMLALRITTMRRDSLLIVDTVRTRQKVAASHSRVLIETLTIDTIPVLQQASGMNIINKKKLTTTRPQEHVPSRKRKKEKRLAHTKVISPSAPQTSDEKMETIVAQTNKQEKPNTPQRQKELSKIDQFKTKHNRIEGITIAKPIERPTMSHYSMLDHIRQKRVYEALGLYPVEVSAQTYLPETGASSAIDMDVINGGEPPTGVSPAYAKMAVKKPLQSYEVLITNFFEEAARISDSYIKEVYTLEVGDQVVVNTNFMTASKKRVYTKAIPDQTKIFPISESYVLESNRIILDKAASYRRMIRKISYKRLQFAEQYDQNNLSKEEIVTTAMSYVEKVIAEQLVHYWYGCVFDVQSTIITPGEEEITAINFPIMLLQQMGWTLNNKTLSNKTSLEQLTYFFDANLLTDCADRMAVRQVLLEKGIGLYIAVIEEHMVYFFHDGVDQYMIYATPYKKPMIVREYLQTVPILDQFKQAKIGKLSNDPKWIKQWLTIDEIVAD